MPELARIFLLLLLAAIVVNLAQGGPDQAKRWLAAKFLGRGGDTLDRTAANRHVAATAGQGVAAGVHLGPHA